MLVIKCKPAFPNAYPIECDILGSQCFADSDGQIEILTKRDNTYNIQYNCCYWQDFDDFLSWNLIAFGLILLTISDTPSIP